jgi:hypothetical protein
LRNRRAERKKLPVVGQQSAKENWGERWGLNPRRRRTLCRELGASRKNDARFLGSTLAFHLRGGRRGSFIKEETDESAQGGFVFHPRVGAVSGGGANDAFPIDHYHLRATNHLRQISQSSMAN